MNFSYSACMYVQYVFKLHGKTVSLNANDIMLNVEKQWCEVTLPTTVPDGEDMNYMYVWCIKKSSIARKEKKIYIFKPKL